MLRPRGVGDIDDVVAMDSDPQVRRFLPPAFRDGFDAAAYRAILPERIATDHGPGLGHWILVARAHPNAFVGTALLIPVEGRGPDVEIGWRLPRTHWGKGFASEAARQIVLHARRTGLAELVALIHPDNAASIGVARKLGFAPDGSRDAYGTTFRLHRLASRKSLTAAGFRIRYPPHEHDRDQHPTPPSHPPMSVCGRVP
ncbi:MAG: GNAT family N-acetyltransferase [Phreatobacter sp.]|uniref:GNAT family N-acetyltransferase n=1 Tax=Phreatobacter sp. TaxID=1966341 RepID=UPI001A61E1C9|nr:GNAT family N-acetyltransferase [Phreatobacter sp.]MBL8569902.1 GNAT family N-acetyltransferase [Phreatobacter sp.]